MCPLYFLQIDDVCVALDSLELTSSEGEAFCSSARIVE